MTSFDYTHKLTNDLLQQFKGKANTSVLITALANQLQGVCQMFSDLNEKRSVDTALYAQLNGVGDIVVLSRAQARAWESKLMSSNVMDDERYRDYLKYKIFQNTSICTYTDVYRALKMFWTETPLYYSEDPAHPATMIFSTPVSGPETDFTKLRKIPAVKAGGVKLLIETATETPLPETKLHAGGVVFGSTVTINLPHL